MKRASFELERNRIPVLRKARSTPGKSWPGWDFWGGINLFIFAFRQVYHSK